MYEEALEHEPTLLFRRLLGRRQRRLPSPAHCVFLDVGEEGAQAVEVAKRERVVLVIVASRTGQRHTQEYRAQHFDSVEVVLGLKLCRNHAAFRRARIHADETRRHVLLQRGIG